MSVIIIISTPPKSGNNTANTMVFGTPTEEQKKAIVEKLGGTYNADNSQAGTSGTNNAGY